MAPTCCPLFEDSTGQLDCTSEPLRLQLISYPSCILIVRCDSVPVHWGGCPIVGPSKSRLSSPLLSLLSPLLLLIFNVSQFPDRDWSSKASPARSSCRASHVSQWARYSHRRRSLPECPGRRGRLVSLPLSLEECSRIWSPLLPLCRALRKLAHS